MSSSTVLLITSLLVISGINAQCNYPECSDNSACSGEFCDLIGVAPGSCGYCKLCYYYSACAADWECTDMNGLPTGTTCDTSVTDENGCGQCIVPPPETTTTPKICYMLGDNLCFEDWECTTMWGLDEATCDVSLLDVNDCGQCTEPPTTARPTTTDSATAEPTTAEPTMFSLKPCYYGSTCRDALIDCTYGQYCNTNGPLVDDCYPCETLHCPSFGGCLYDYECEGDATCDMSNFDGLGCGQCLADATTLPPMCPDRYECLTNDDCYNGEFCDRVGVSPGECGSCSYCYYYGHCYIDWDCTEFLSLNNTVCDTSAVDENGCGYCTPNKSPDFCYTLGNNLCVQDWECTDMWVIAGGKCDTSVLDAKGCGQCTSSPTTTRPPFCYMTGTNVCSDNWECTDMWFIEGGICDMSVLDDNHCGHCVEPGTAEPTTDAPTTAEPTTAEPTTAEPTTGTPTTAEPTTSEPTTSDPTTPEPTTGDPTTAEPTTEPTTSDPTTAMPTKPFCDIQKTVDEGDYRWDNNGRPAESGIFDGCQFCVCPAAGNKQCVNIFDEQQPNQWDHIARVTFLDEISHIFNGTELGLCGPQDIYVKDIGEVIECGFEAFECDADGGDTDTNDDEVGDNGSGVQMITAMIGMGFGFIMLVFI